MPPRKRLSREDWTAAALEILVTEGPDAVAIEPIAASLGATKGSGYWHFASRRELLESALSAWRVTATDDVISHLDEGGGTAVERMGRLLARVSVAAERSPAEMLVMSSADPSVRSAVAAAMTTRLAYLERLLVEAGLPRAEARTRAVLAYSAYLGFAMLATSSPGVLPHRPADRRRMQRVMLDLTAVDRPEDVFSGTSGSGGTSRRDRS